MKAPFAREYAALKRGILAAGFDAQLEIHSTRYQRMSCNWIYPDHRSACIWVRRRRGGWLVGTYSPRIFRLANADLITELVLEMLRGPRRTPYDLPVPLKTKYSLVEVDDV